MAPLPLLVKAGCNHSDFDLPIVGRILHRAKDDIGLRVRRLELQRFRERSGRQDIHQKGPSTAYIIGG